MYEYVWIEYVYWQDVDGDGGGSWGLWRESVGYWTSEEA